MNAADDRPADRATGDVDRPRAEEQRVHEHRRLHALARDHQKRESKDAHEGRRPGLDRRRGQPTLDVLLHVPTRAPHVDRQRCHQHGGGNAEDAFPERLIAGAGQQQAGADAQDDRHHDAPVHGGHELAPLGLLQVGETNRDDEKGFEPFTKGDDERLQHVPPWQTRNRPGLLSSVVSRSPTGQVGDRTWV